MSLAESIYEIVQTLPADKQQEVLQFVESLKKLPGKSERKQLLGVFQHLNPCLTKAEFDEARREMWTNFPRNFPGGKAE